MTMTNPTPVKCSTLSSFVDDYSEEIVQEILALAINSGLDSEQGISSSQTLDAGNYQNSESFSGIHRVPTTATSELVAPLPSSSDNVKHELAACMSLRANSQGSYSSQILNAPNYQNSEAFSNIHRVPPSATSELLAQPPTSPDHVKNDFAAHMSLRVNSQGSTSSSQYPHSIDRYSWCQWCAPTGSDDYFDISNLEIVQCPEHEAVIASFIRECKFLAMARDEKWSHCFQHVFSLGDPEVNRVIVKRVTENVYDLMESKYGKHLFVRVIHSCNAYQKQKIIMKITSDKNSLIRASIDPHGSYSVKRLIEILRHSDAVFQVTSVLAMEIGLLMMNQHGKGVIKQCLIHLDAQKNGPLCEAILKNCIILATHKVACSNLYACISSMPNPYRGLVLHVIADNAVTLARHPSGNYVVQHVLELGDQMITQKICYTLQGNYLRLSKDFSGSHVVEKCLKSSGIVYVIQEFISCGGQLAEAAKDQFGNYVVQKALQETKRASMELHQRLQRALEPHLQSLQFHRYGKNVYVHSCLLRGYSIKPQGMA